MRAVRLVASAFALAGALVLPLAAGADVQHVVGRGQTIEAIANRYHVTSKAIIEANQITNVKRVHPGDVLVIPTKNGSPKGDAKKNDKKHEGAVANVGKPQSRETTNYAMKPKTPDVLHIRRVAMNEDYEVHVGHGRVSPATLKTFEKMMRSQDNLAHPIDPRLITLLGIVSNHFGSRKIEIISGFRPFTPTQYNPHSNHMHGKAVDFRIVGVPNETVRDFCRTLKNVGCGYYPNSIFVHMDVRDKSTFWIDYSKPGEPPRYNAPNLEADEGTSDVHEEDTTPMKDEDVQNTGAEAAGAMVAPSASASSQPAAPPSAASSPATTGSSVP
ncbi:MAG: DUF882 domain-containing protein [Polyangiaceae bacterium]|nr:DUF882 domain-containing protein [Polyangiaceae bacterium]